MTVNWHDVQDGLRGGVLVYDFHHSTWYKLSDHSPDAGLLWLPDETGLIAGYGLRNQQHPVMDLVNHFTWFCYHLDGSSQQLTDMANCIAWTLVPDGSGIVTTVVDEQTRQGIAKTEVRIRIKIFDLITRQWHDTGFPHHG